MTGSMKPVDLRWSRGCGNGIGPSDHTNEYLPATLVNNYVQDRAAAQQAAEGRHYLGLHMPGNFNTAYRSAYMRTAAEYQAALASGTPVVTSDVLREDKGRAVLLETAVGGEPRVDAEASISALTLSAPHAGKRRVQQELWGGGKANNLAVTRSVKRVAGVTTAKEGAWRDAARAAAEPTRSETRDSTLTAALGAAAFVGDAAGALASGTRRLREQVDAPVGRQPGGECARAAAMPHQKLHFRHPLPYTVQLSTATAAQPAATGAVEA